MRKEILSVATLLTLLALLLVGTSSTLAQPPEHHWVSEYVFDIPDGACSEGTHTYTIEFTWTYPEPDSFTSDPFAFVISQDAPIYDGYALLRVGTAFVQLPPPDNQCGDLDPIILHPDQPMRFHLGWDWIAQYPEALAHYESVVPLITWDCEPDSVLLERHEIFPIIEKSWERVWHNARCNWTHRP